MLVWIPLSESRKKVPNFIIIRVEYMRTIKMYIDPIFIKIVKTITTNMIPRINYCHLMRLFGKFASQCNSCDTTANNKKYHCIEIVIVKFKLLKKRPL